MKNFHTVLLTLFSSILFANNFTPGNVVVVRVGDGSAALTNAATAVFLDEYNPITRQLVQSIALPTSVSGANKRLTLSGTATSEGALTLSPNKQFLCLAGHDTTLGTSSVAGAANMNKSVAIVNALGVVNTSTFIPAGGGYNANNIRGAVTNDGTDVWTSGAGASNSGGTFYIPTGTSTPTKVSAAPTNTRAINIFEGQLYTSAASSTFYGVSAVGTGLPTTSGNTTTILPGFPGATTGSSTYAFALFDLNASEPGLDVAYLADDNNTTGGIIKYSKVGGTWVQNGNITATKALRGLTLTNACGVIRGFATSEDSIYTFTDNAGYNLPISGAVTGLIGRTSGNVALRGIAFAPNTPDPVAPTANATNVKDARCFGATNGEATISATGGTGTLTYAWSDNGSGATRTNLSAGTYTVTVSDLIGCTTVVSNIQIEEPTALALATTKANASCFGLTDGSITPNTNGGTTPYQYAFSSGNGSNLAAGIYTVTVTDGNQCTATKRDTITQPQLLTLTTVKGNVTCGSTDNGFINVTVNGGNGGNGFLWNDNVTTQSRTNLTAGTYTLVVTDSKNCTASKTDTILQTNDLSVNGVANNISCYEAADGSITISVVGGTGVYTYDWGGGVTDTNRSNLSDGTYSVTVSDNGSCTGTNTFSITQPDSLTISALVNNISCYLQNNGNVLITATGGTPVYAISWSGGLTGFNPLSLAAGVYSYTVTDNNQCSKSSSVTITQPDSLVLTGTVTNVTAPGGNDGAITLSISGGTPNYEYLWDDNTQTANRNNLQAGLYTVVVTDDKGCTKQATFTVSQPSSVGVIGEVIWLKNLIVNASAITYEVELGAASDVSVAIYNAAGQMVKTTTSTTATYNTIDVTDLNSGVYLLQFKSAAGVVTRRVSIAR